MKNQVSIIDGKIDFGRIIPKYFDSTKIKDSTILIKIDTYSGLKSQQSGTTTNIKLVESLIQSLNVFSPKKILIADSENKDDLNLIFDTIGYSELTLKYQNVELLNLSHGRTVSYIGEKDYKIRNQEFSEKLNFIDFFIIFSNLKSHVAEKISGCWLSQLNYLANNEQKIVLQPFSFYIAYDLYRFFKPSLCILDATTILGTMGPVEGQPRKMNKIIIGNNPCLTDICAARLLKLDYKTIPTLKYAVKKLKLKKIVEKITGQIQPINIDFQKLSSLHFFIFKFSYFINRLSIYLNNFAYLIFLGGMALISIGGKDLVTGRWMSINNYFKIAKEVITKINKADNLLNLKITINNHVKEQSIS
ncbi:MAG: DUF362 domain-containing protein [Patescibacteria group bacterium]|jgi:uncharacterized protein (DUF362 family)